MEGSIILSTVAEGIIASLGSLPVKKIVQLWGVEGELEKLEETVSTIKDVLLDAEEQQDGNPEVRVWLKKLQKPMYDADDLLDDVSSEDLPDDGSSEALPEEDKKKKTLRSKLMDHVAKPFKSNQVPAQLLLEKDKKKKECNDISKSNQVPQHPSHIGHKMKDIREKLDAIAAGRNFTLERHPTQIGIKNKRREDDTYSFVFEEDVIGREEDKKKVVALLLDSNVGKNVSILPIVGIGGLGKTTLAKLIFNDQEVQKYFELKMWVCVSDIFDIKILVKNILESMTGNKQDVGLEALAVSLKNLIGGKKYLLVLDDVWNEDREKWFRFKSLLMGGARGSRVLLTTRSDKVARISKTIEPYPLKGLGEQDSWSLFKKIAFEEGKVPENTRIVATGKEIVAKCVGVPLAIRTIGGFLYFQHPETAWLSFMANDLSKIPQNENDIIPTLKLSYDKLPSHLKQCFAYCSLFPKDYKFVKSTLIYLWMAQGFISVANQHQELEDIGHDYFMGLLWRSFFQEAEVDEFGDVIGCKMHDLMHDLATLVAGSLITPLNSIDEKTLHLSIDSFPVVTTSLSTYKRIRTLLLLREGRGTMTESTCDAMFSNFQFLRALSAPELNFEPTFIFKLKHLRSLDLSHNIVIIKLSDSITNLQYLQTLRLSSCWSLEELPSDIKKLVNLRHLEIDGCKALKYMPRGLGELTNLQTLSQFLIPSSSISKDYGDLSELNKMNSLRGELVISIGRNGKDVASKCKAANLKEKKYLRFLQLEWTSESLQLEWTDKSLSFLLFEWTHKSDVSDSSTEDVLFTELEGLQPHPNLKSLSILDYRGIKFPSWLSSLVNLVELSLVSCKKLQYLPPLSLPSLRSIYLRDLPDLKYISNSGDNIESVEMNTETLVMDPHLLLSFPPLSTLNIMECPMLTSMPTFPSVERELLLSNVSVKLLQQTMMMNNVVEAQRSTLTAIASSSKLVASPTPLSKLKRLTLDRIWDLETLPEDWLQKLTSLEFLDIANCHRLNSLTQGIQHLTALQDLRIQCCHALDVCNDEDGMKWQGLKSLLSLKFDSLPKLVSLPLGLQHLTALQSLSLECCDALDVCNDEVGMHLWQGLKSLLSLKFDSLPKLESLPLGLQHLTALRSLSLEHCDALDVCNDKVEMHWQGLKSLLSLKFNSLPKLASLPLGLQHVTTLQKLYIHRCDSFKALPEWIDNCTSLVHLEINGCSSLTSLPKGMRGLPSIQRLNIWGSSPDLLEGCKREAGVDWFKISHIPEIDIN